MDYEADYQQGHRAPHGSWILDAIVVSAGCSGWPLAADGWMINEK
jgi:hypothetical protein